MDFDNDFFIQAQGVIERVFRAERQRLLAANGNIENELKGDKTPVTELDKEVEAKLRDVLNKFDSSIGIEGEEYGIDGSREIFWLVDPIDGTESFIRGGSEFRNMATLVQNGKPIFTVIYKPVQDQLIVAADGEGAFQNGRPICLKQRPLNRARIEIHAPSPNPDVWSMLQTLSEHLNLVRITGEFTNVATGQLDGLLAYKAKGGPWDFAARGLLLKEAGAKVANLGKTTYDYTINDMLAAHPSIFDELMDIIVKKDAEL